MNQKFIDVALTEYSALREELRLKIQAQYTVMALMVSAVGIIFGLGANAKGTVDLIDANVISFLFCLILPSAIMFFGIIWLDQVYRQVMIGRYIVKIEMKINKALQVENTEEDAAIFWEQWLSLQRNPKKFILKTNYYYYYICLGLFLSFPVATFMFGIMLSNHKSTILPALIAITMIVFAVFILFVFSYWTKISSFEETIEEGE